MTVEVSNESGIDVSEDELISVARFVISKMDVNPAAELSMVLVDQSAMADLHMRWMDLPGPTDVMSFPMDELRPGREGVEPQEGMLGDIVLCPSVAARQAREAGHGQRHEPDDEACPRELVDPDEQDEQRDQAEVGLRVDGVEPRLGDGAGPDREQDGGGDA